MSFLKTLKSRLANADERFNELNVKLTKSDICHAKVSQPAIKIKTNIGAHHGKENVNMKEK